jgi:hypothetical protein
MMIDLGDFGQHIKDDLERLKEEYNTANEAYMGFMKGIKEVKEKETFLFNQKQKAWDEFTKKTRRYRIERQERKSQVFKRAANDKKLNILKLIERGKGTLDDYVFFSKSGKVLTLISSDINMISSVEEISDKLSRNQLDSFKNEEWRSAVINYAEGIFSGLTEKYHFFENKKNGKIYLSSASFTALKAANDSGWHPQSKIFVEYAQSCRNVLLPLDEIYTVIED